MLKKIFALLLRRFEKQNNYDVSYSRYILKHSTPAFWKFSQINAFAGHNEGLPRDVLFAIKITSTLKADCGPCTQLVTGWAEKAGVPAATIRAILTRDFDRMPADVALAVRFTNAALNRDLEADAMRERIRMKWGDKGVISAAFAITGGQIFPTLKYALGYGHACGLVSVGNELVRVSHEPSKMLQAI